MSRASRRTFFAHAAAFGALIAGWTGSGRLARAQETDAKAIPAWRADGLYAMACNCDSLCPCELLAAPTKGYCQALNAWYVEQGHFGDVQLDGLNAVLAVYAPEQILNGNLKVALYVDDRADARQREALSGIFLGKAGGPLAGLVPLVGQTLGVKAVPIDFQVQGRRRSFSIPSIVQGEIAAIEGAGGAEVTLQNAPFSVVPGHPTVLARSTRAAYNDYGLKWELTEKNAFYAPFSYAPS